MGIGKPPRVDCTRRDVEVLNEVAQTIGGVRDCLFDTPKLVLE